MVFKLIPRKFYGILSKIIFKGLFITSIISFTTVLTFISCITFFLNRKQLLVSCNLAWNNMGDLF